MAKKYLFTDDGTAPVAGGGATDDNLKFKKRTKASIPKMNFHVWAVPRDSNYADNATPPGVEPVTEWRYIGGFTDISGLSANTEIIEYSDAGTKGLSIKSQGNVSYGNITLNRGFDSDAFIASWAAQGQSLIGNSDRRLLDLVILKLSQDAKSVVRVFLVRNAQVASYTAGDMDTTTVDPWVETVELALDVWNYGNVFGTESSIKLGSTLTGERTYLRHNDFMSGFYYDDSGSTPVYTENTPNNFFVYALPNGEQDVM